MSELEQAAEAARLGERLAGAGRWAEAAAAFERALAGAPGDAMLHNNLAVALFQGGQVAA
ncbi:MAG: tetratricopeptide repeat protein, partial [Proteobacteria bacterium]|nr:tetratricopeptide repeat protein [Pseudomonadota bacterium]